MSETIIWKELSHILLKYGDASRHEDKYSEGIPDISYAVNETHGWIESKFIDKWPIRNKTINLRKFTTKQRKWITKRHDIAGNCYIILLVGKEKSTREFLIFTGGYAMKLGHVTRKEMYKNSIWKGNDRDIYEQDIITLFTDLDTKY